MWEFCKSSEPQLQRCISLAGRNKTENKWAKAFCRNPKPAVDIMKVDHDFIQEVKEIDSVAAEVCNNILGVTEIDEELIENIESEPVLRFEEIFENGIRNPDIFKNLAQKLSEASIEKICKHIFSKYNDNIILIHFHDFFTEFLKRNFNQISLELLVMSSKTSSFDKLLMKIIKDLEIPSNVLQEYNNIISQKEQAQFLQIIIEIDYTEKEFKHHLFTIYSVYKDSIKTEHIQNILLSLLLQQGSHNSNNKNYGRLLLSFLQGQNSLKLLIDTKIVDVVENHCSPFRRPCQTVLGEIKKRMFTEC